MTGEGQVVKGVAARSLVGFNEAPAWMTGEGSVRTGGSFSMRTCPLQ